MAAVFQRLRSTCAPISVARVSAALFSVLNTLLLQRLPYRDAARLAVVWEHNLPRDRKKNVVSPGNFLHWREMNQVFTDMAAVSLAFPTSLTA